MTVSSIKTDVGDLDGCARPSAHLGVRGTSAGPLVILSAYMLSTLCLRDSLNGK